MAYQALYRAFRPTTLDGLVRQEHIVRILKNQIATGRVGHAYLFCGPRGTGKTSTAKIFARAINCESPVDGSPCGKCAACRALADPANLDVTEIDAASNNGVNEMRDLREKVQYPPVACRYKVYIVDEVHMLSDSAFNALLKTLEEPPKHAVFILATTEPHKLPATILSRCMRFDFKLIPQEDIEAHLKTVLKAVGKEYEDEAVAAIARAGAGSMRDSLSVADMCISYSTGKLTYADVNEVLGSADFYEIAKLGEAILTENASDALTETEKVLSSGKGAAVLARDLLSFFNRCTVAKTCRNGNALLQLPEEMYAETARIASAADGRALLRVSEIFAGVETELRYSVSPRVVLETAVVKASLPETDGSALALGRRIEKLEERLRALQAGGAGQGARPASAAPSAHAERARSVPAADEAGMPFAEEYPAEAYPVPPEEDPFSPPPAPPEEDVPYVPPRLREEAPAKRAETHVNALDADKRKSAFAYFLRTLRKGAKNGVLFTMCQDLESAFEGDTFVLTTDSDAIYRLLRQENHEKAVAAALGEIGITSFEIRLKGAAPDPVEEGIAKLKRDFPDTEIRIK